MKLSPKMLETLKAIGHRKVTGFGSILESIQFNLNANSVQALIKRGMLEPSGEKEWNGMNTPDGRHLSDTVHIYQISQAGKQALSESESK